jgi:hypothetical protein
MTESKRVLAFKARCERHIKAYNLSVVEAMQLAERALKRREFLTPTERDVIHNYCVSIMKNLTQVAGYDSHDAEFYISCLGLLKA